MDTDHYLSPFFLGSAGTWQCQATHVYHFITQAQEQALRVAERTHHSLGLWPLSGPVLILSSDRRIQAESHLPLRRTPPHPPRLTFPPTRRFQHSSPPPRLPGPLSLPVPDPAAGYHFYNVSLLYPGTWDRT